MDLQYCTNCGEPFPCEEPGTCAACERKHVWCIDATCIAEFDSYEECIKEYDALPEDVEITMGDKKFMVKKSDIAVMPLLAFNTL